VTVEQLIVSMVCDYTRVLHSLLQTGLWLVCLCLSVSVSTSHSLCLSITLYAPTMSSRNDTSNYPAAIEVAGSGASSSSSPSSTTTAGAAAPATAATVAALRYHESEDGVVTLEVKSDLKVKVQELCTLVFDFPAPFVNDDGELCMSVATSKSMSLSPSSMTSMTCSPGPGPGADHGSDHSDSRFRAASSSSPLSSSSPPPSVGNADNTVARRKGMISTETILAPLAETLQWMKKVTSVLAHLTQSKELGGQFNTTTTTTTTTTAATNFHDVLGSVMEIQFQRTCERISKFICHAAQHRKFSGPAKVAFIRLVNFTLQISFVMCINDMITDGSTITSYIDRFYKTLREVHSHQLKDNMRDTMRIIGLGYFFLFIRLLRSNSATFNQVQSTKMCKNTFRLGYHVITEIRKSGVLAASSSRVLADNTALSQLFQHIFHAMRTVLGFNPQRDLSSCFIRDISHTILQLAVISKSICIRWTALAALEAIRPEHIAGVDQSAWKPVQEMAELLLDTTWTGSKHRKQKRRKLAEAEKSFVQLARANNFCDMKQIRSMANHMKPLASQWSAVAGSSPTLGTSPTAETDSMIAWKVADESTDATTAAEQCAREYSLRLVAICITLTREWPWTSKKQRAANGTHYQLQQKGVWLTNVLPTLNNYLSDTSARVKYQLCSIAWGQFVQSYFHCSPLHNDADNIFKPEFLQLCVVFVRRMFEDQSTLRKFRLITRTNLAQQYLETPRVSADGKHEVRTHNNFVAQVSGSPIVSCHTLVHRAVAILWRDILSRLAPSLNFALPANICSDVKRAPLVPSGVQQSTVASMVLWAPLHTMLRHPDPAICLAGTYVLRCLTRSAAGSSSNAAATGAGSSSFISPYVLDGFAQVSIAANNSSSSEFKTTSDWLIANRPMFTGMIMSIPACLDRIIACIPIMDGIAGGTNTDIASLCQFMDSFRANGTTCNMEDAMHVWTRANNYVFEALTGWIDATADVIRDMCNEQGVADMSELDSIEAITLLSDLIAVVWSFLSYCPDHSIVLVRRPECQVRQGSCQQSFTHAEYDREEYPTKLFERLRFTQLNVFKHLFGRLYGKKYDDGDSDATTAAGPLIPLLMPLPFVPSALFANLPPVAYSSDSLQYALGKSCLKDSLAMYVLAAQPHFTYTASEPASAAESTGGDTDMDTESASTLSLAGFLFAMALQSVQCCNHRQDFVKNIVQKVVLKSDLFLQTGSSNASPVIALDSRAKHAQMLLRVLRVQCQFAEECNSDCVGASSDALQTGSAYILSTLRKSTEEALDIKQNGESYSSSALRELLRSPGIAPAFHNTIHMLISTLVLQLKFRITARMRSVLRTPHETSVREMYTLLFKKMPAVTKHIMSTMADNYCKLTFEDADTVAIASTCLWSMLKANRGNTGDTSTTAHVAFPIDESLAVSLLMCMLETVYDHHCDGTSLYDLVGSSRKAGKDALVPWTTHSKALQSVQLVCRAALNSFTHAVVNGTPTDRTVVCRVFGDFLKSLNRVCTRIRDTKCGSELERLELGATAISWFEHIVVDVAECTARLGAIASSDASCEPSRIVQLCTLLKSVLNNMSKALVTSVSSSAIQSLLRLNTFNSYGELISRSLRTALASTSYGSSVLATLEPDTKMSSAAAVTAPVSPSRKRAAADTSIIDELRDANRVSEESKKARLTAVARAAHNKQTRVTIQSTAAASVSASASAAGLSVPALKRRKIQYEKVQGQVSTTHTPNRRREAGLMSYTELDKTISQSQAQSSFEDTQSQSQSQQIEYHFEPPPQRSCIKSHTNTKLDSDVPCTSSTASRSRRVRLVVASRKGLMKTVHPGSESESGGSQSSIGIAAPLSPSSSSPPSSPSSSIPSHGIHTADDTPTPADVDATPAAAATSVEVAAAVSTAESPRLVLSTMKCSVCNSSCEPSHQVWFRCLSCRGNKFICSSCACSTEAASNSLRNNTHHNQCALLRIRVSDIDDSCDTESLMSLVGSPAAALSLQQQLLRAATELGESLQSHFSAM
jgi:hypothetical protein